jgi:hypothetical protein
MGLVRNVCGQKTAATAPHRSVPYARHLALPLRFRCRLETNCERMEGSGGAKRLPLSRHLARQRSGL